jgi:hypothetical protein
VLIDVLACYLELIHALHHFGMILLAWGVRKLARADGDDLAAEVAGDRHAACHEIEARVYIGSTFGASEWSLWLKLNHRDCFSLCRWVC